ncbi:MAG TPA: hypothetical protein VJ777_26435 [Mycobacterium sp.]|nr:hypothetical protein [Mycobacterium sp.]
MTLKSLVTGVAAAALVGGAAAGVTSIASGTISAAPAVQPVVFDIPLPQTPAPDLEGPLAQTLQALAGGGSFSGKAPYIQGGIGRIESIAADRAYKNAAAEGKFPLTFFIANIDQNGPVATADVTATAATGGTATQNIQFVAGPSPSGWQISKNSALSLLSSVG